MFDLRKMLMVGSLIPLLTDDRRVVISEHAPAGSMQPIWRMPATYPRSSRSAGYRAHKRWRQRRASGRA